MTDPRPACIAAANLAGEHVPCDWPTNENGEHPGWAHSNRAHELIWTDDPQALRDAWASAGEAGR